MTRARHLNLMNGSFMGLGPERDQFLADLVADARAADDARLAEELRGDWRDRLTAAWLIAVDRRVHWRGEVGRLLLEHRYTYSTQGYAVALVRFGDAEPLASFLDQVENTSKCGPDQGWVHGALQYLDSERAARYLAPDGPWAGRKLHFDPDIGRMMFADTYRLIPG